MPSLFRKTHPLIYCVNGFREAQELQLRMVLGHEVPAWRLALETINYLFGVVFDCDASRTREYVLTHPVAYGEGQTFAQLFFCSLASSDREAGELHGLHATADSAVR